MRRLLWKSNCSLPLPQQHLYRKDALVELIGCIGIIIYMVIAFAVFGLLCSQTNLPFWAVAILGTLISFVIHLMLLSLASKFTDSMVKKHKK